MSKYRKGACYLRKMKARDKSDDLRTRMRMAMFSDKSAWKHPEQIKPVVVVRHGIKRVMGVFMNMDDATASLFPWMIKERRRNSRHNPHRGMKHTKGDLKKAFRMWAFKHDQEQAA
ncbi:hypothetical protein PC510_003835 [Escherichia coli]|uniref:hypothetical protein n=1 Tax=Escherichia coli TaxID=562 RepID=UPI00178D0D25|nr:hypothetical protein [Escherichia coli]EKI3096558.1 hypothetical protein [Escherichia coli]MBB9841057.1 hypothetical protein [Escherichia coli]MBS9328483.1 hypothetical protein [Escherichia coli]